MADIDDDLDYNEEEMESSGIFRWLQTAVVLFALGGFFGLAWYAYKSGENVDDKDVELVKVDKTPVKEVPANPGGMQIPNQDKTVYGLINNKPENQVVERIVPPTEEPAVAQGEAETWTNSKIDGKEAENANAAKPSKSVNVPPVKETVAADHPDKARETGQFNPARIKEMKTADNTPSAIIEQPATPVAQEQKAEPKAEAKAAPAAQPQAAKTAPEPEQVTEKPVAEKAVPAKPAPAETKAASAADASKLPKIRIQLGALRSEAEAEKIWAKIASQFADEMGGKQHYIVRVTVNGKVFYRLQAAPFSTAQEAESLCVTMVASGQGCFLAKGK